VLDAHAARWGLELDAMLPGGRLSACVAGRDASGRAVVLKVPTSARAGRRELAALRAWAACPVPQVYRSDARTGVFAMERILPGSALRRDAADAVAPVLASLHAAGGAAVSSGRFPPLRDALLDRLRRAGQRCALRGNDVGRALHTRAAAQLVAAPGPPSRPPALLHGDFQAKNLLERAGTAVAAIDPLPCVGDPAFDAATWSVLSPAPEPIAARVAAISRALHCDPAPIAGWAALLCALEYRPYRPEQAERMLAYAGG
jgi:streptomycin 6-kinase